MRSELNMRTVDLDTLVKVVEYGSLSQAANALHLTQSAVSQRLKNLETYFGQPLLNRGTPMTLTAKGEQVIRCGRQILALEEEMREAPLGDAEALRVFCTPVFGYSRLPSVMQRFNQHMGTHANLSVLQGIPEDAIKGINEELLDLAVLEHHHPLPQHRGEHHCLTPEHVIFVVKTGVALPCNLKELQQHRLYTARAGCSSRDLLEDNLESMGSSLNEFPSVVVMDDLNLAMEAILSGQGIAFIAHSLALPLLQSGKAMGFELPGFEHYLRRSLLTQVSSNEMADHFIRYIEESLSPKVTPLTDAG